MSKQRYVDFWKNTMPRLSLEQQNAVRGVVSTIKKGKRETQLSGFAGTGKTTCLAVIAEVFDTFAVCAYTGKAANVLRKKGMDASTIHSLIYKPVQVSNGRIEFWLRDRTEFTFDGFLVDESSMVSKEIYDDMLTFEVPIVFVGDHGQLEPVGSNINVMANPQFCLETVHRNAGEIAFFAEHIRRGGLPRTFHTDSKVEFVTPKEVTDQMLLDSGQMICAYNATRVEKNARVRELQGRKGLLEEGERIMCLRNNRLMGLFNGMQGEVRKVHKKHARMTFWTDGVTYVDLSYDPNQFGKEKNQFEFGADTPNPFDYAYCITCHKSQGDEFDHVMVFEQVCDKWEHKKWAYTAASRAKEKLRWVCPKLSTFRPSWL